MAVAKWLLNDLLKKDIAKPLLEFLRLILHNTNFTVNDEHYLQIGGTSMETPCFLSFTNLFLDKFETNALSNAPFKPSHYFRFIDDIWFVWTQGEDKLL